MVDVPRSLHRKLAQVMYEAERIPKRGKAPAAMGGFDFVQVGDAADIIRKALADQKISMLPTAIELLGESEHPTSSGKLMTTMTVRTTWTLTDGDSGETATIQSMGSGGDMGDKAIPKAQTNAMKYALLMGFLLSTGDDPELADTSDRRALRVAPSEPVPDALPNDGSLIGTIVAGKPPCDLGLRQTPDGPATGFKLVQGRGGLQVLASGNLATALHPFLEGLVDQRVSVWGHVVMIPWAKDGKDMPPYKRLILSKIKTADWTLPGDVPTAREAPEAESEPLFAKDDDLAGLPDDWQEAVRTGR